MNSYKILSGKMDKENETVAHHCVDTITNSLQSLNLSSNRNAADVNEISQDNLSKINDTINEKEFEQKNAFDENNERISAEYKPTSYKKLPSQRRSKKKPVVKIETCLSDDSSDIIDRYLLPSSKIFNEQNKLQIKKEKEIFFDENASNENFVCKEVNSDPEKKPFDWYSDDDNFDNNHMSMHNSDIKNIPILIERGKMVSKKDTDSSTPYLASYKNRNLSHLSGGKIMQTHTDIGRKLLDASCHLDYNFAHIEKSKFCLTSKNIEDIMGSTDVPHGTHVIQDVYSSRNVESPESGYGSPTYDLTSSPVTSQDSCSYLLSPFSQDSDTFDFNKEELVNYIQRADNTQIFANDVMSEEEMNRTLDDIIEVINTDCSPDFSTDASEKQFSLSNTDIEVPNVTTMPMPDKVTISSNTTSDKISKSSNITSTVSDDIISPHITTISMSKEVAKKPSITYLQLVPSVVVNVFPVVIEQPKKTSTIGVGKSFRKIKPKPAKSTLQENLDTIKKEQCLRSIYGGVSKTDGCICIVDEATKSTNLHIAVQGSRPDKLEYVYSLVVVHVQYRGKKAKEDVNMVDSLGKTALNYAVEAKEFLIASFLEKYH